MGGGINYLIYIRCARNINCHEVREGESDFFEVKSGGGGEEGRGIVQKLEEEIFGGCGLRLGRHNVFYPLL